MNRKVNIKTSIITFSLIILGLNLVALFLFFNPVSRESSIFNSSTGITSDTITPQELEESSIQMGRWFQNNQNPGGDFVYERVATNEAVLNTNGIVRQAFSLYSLALLYQRTGDESLKDTIEKGIGFFQTLSHTSIQNYDQTELTVSQVRQGHNRLNNTSAFVLLTLIEYISANPDADEKYGYYVEDLANFLLTTQLPNGGFMAGENQEEQDDFNNGETFYALVRAYQHTNNKMYLYSAKKAADYMSVRYGDDFNSSFYGWGMRGYYYLNQIEPQDKYWEYMKHITDLYFQKFGVLYEDYYDGRGIAAPGPHIAAYMEGMVHVAQLAQNRDPGYAEKLKKHILRSYKFILRFQIGNKYSEKNSDSKLLSGGVCMGYHCQTLRIDTTGHVLSAFLFYLKYLN